MTRKNGSFFNALWKITVDVCRKAQVPLYLERHDPKVFTTVQKIFLCLYKAKKQLTLRGLIDDLSSSKVVSYLRLVRIPNFSTLSRFLTTLPERVLVALDATVQTLLPSTDAVIIDSTGFECTHPSHYYCRRINSPYPVDGFLTLYTIIDQEHGYIRAHAARAKKVHDSKMLKPLVKNLQAKPLKLYADRGFDSEENYRFLVEDVGCFPFILQKNMLKPVQVCTGDYRREIRPIFDYGEYLKRNKIEGVYAGLKRQCGSTVATKKVSTQRKELRIKVLVYNLEKKVRSIILIIILRLKTSQQNLK